MINTKEQNQAERRISPLEREFGKRDTEIVERAVYKGWREYCEQNRRYHFDENGIVVLDGGEDY